jgi:aspartate-semialdehyde dehydrogenase
LVFLAVSDARATELAPLAVAQGATVIDHSGAWRFDNDVPLIVPEVNGALVTENTKLIAVPNCTIPGFTMAIDALNSIAKVTDVVVTTMQSASGAGRDGLERYKDCGDVIAHCETFLENGYTTEEEKMLFETRKVLNDNDIKVTMTCVRVPVEVGHAASMLLSFETQVSLDEARSALNNYSGIELLDDHANEVYPTAKSAAGKDSVQIGRLRLEHDGQRLWLWQVTDNLRKGAALNSTQIAEQLLPVLFSR